MFARTQTPALDLPDLEPLDQPCLFQPQAAPSGEALRVPVDRLDEDPLNPRTEFPPAEIDDLASDIAQRGILQPIVVGPPDEAGRYRIRCGSKRWRAARQAGLVEVPVVVDAQLRDVYDQVAENLKRHDLPALDLARFIQGRTEAGDSNATVAKRLGIDITTIAYHLALLRLPAVLQRAMQSGRCASPLTLYELSRLHQDLPEQVAELVDGDQPITREAVAALRKSRLKTRPAGRQPRPSPKRSAPAAKLLGRARLLSRQLDALLLRLSQADTAALDVDRLAALRQQVASLASRQDP